ncbi:MAG: hypothetical protein ACLR7D_05680 [Lachnospira eligens]
MQHQRRLLLNTTVRCRKEKKKKEKKLREDILPNGCVVAVLACIILGSGIATGIKLNSIYKDYIEVDNV